MKKNNIDEYFHCSETKRYDEYHSFKAEQYFGKELKDSPKELKDVPESFEDSDKKSSNKEQENKSEIDEQDLAKRVENVEGNNVAAESATPVATTVASVGTVAATAVTAVVALTVMDVLPFNKNKVPFEVSKDTIKEVLSPNKINLDFDIDNYSSDTGFEIFIEQFDKDGNSLGKDKVDSSLNDNNSHLSLVCDAYYGLASYKFSVQSLDGNDIYFQSDSFDFDCDQSFQASYTKITPNDCHLTYNEDGTFDVEIETGFVCEYEDVFEYKVDVYSTDGVLLKEYIGTDSIIDVKGLNDILGFYIQYQDIGHFKNEDKIFNSFIAEMNTIIHAPVFFLMEKPEFDGLNFMVPYIYETAYEGRKDKVTFEIDSDKGKSTCDYELSSPNGYITFDELEDDIGNVTITPILEFYDYQSDGRSHKLKMSTHSYDFSYSFEITSVDCDFSDDSGDMIPITMEFSGAIPKDYKIKIDNGDTNIQDINIVSETSFNTLNKIDGGTLSVSIFDRNGNLYRKLEDITILSQGKALDIYTSPVYIAANPGDSLVTYNDDGTINLYRLINFPDFPDTDLSYFCDASIYTKTDVSTSTIHCITQDKVAALYDLEKKPYYFLYYSLMKQGIVTYRMEQTMPSGGIEFNEILSAKGTYDSSTDKTEIVISSSMGAYIENKVIYQSQEYSQTDYEMMQGVNLTVTVDGNAIGNQLTCSYSQYSGNYDEIGSIYSIKGNRFMDTTLTIEQS